MLLLRRNASLSFHGGAWVFPGGRVEATDCGEGELERASAAAVREAREECGLQLRTCDLWPDSHWITPLGRPKRFATWFFWARDPGGEVTPDGREITEHRWLAPGAALLEHASGLLELPPPTYVTLDKLSRLPSTHAAEAALRTRAVERFTPRPVSVENGLVSLYEGDAGYAEKDLNRAGSRRRLWMLTQDRLPRWRFEERPSPER